MPDGPTDHVDTLIPLAVSDVRQWTFCPRVLWHRRMMPHRVRETHKMALGREAEDALQRLEQRRVVRRYGLETAIRRFHVPLASERRNVRGTCDLVLDVPPMGNQPRRMHPVEVKRTEGGASPHHTIQLAGYALLLEEQEHLPTASIALGFILLLPADDLVPIELGPIPRTAFERALDDIRTMLEKERFPPHTRHLSFCPQCEYVRFCGDVL